MVLHVFEHHAGKVEAVRCVVNVWILALLNLHTWSMHHPDALPGIIWVAMKFLAAQSIVEILMEFIQMYGYIIIGETWGYWQVENLVDFFVAFVPVYLWVDPSNSLVRATWQKYLPNTHRRRLLKMERWARLHPNGLASLTEIVLEAIKLISFPARCSHSIYSSISIDHI